MHCFYLLGAVILGSMRTKRKGGKVEVLVELEDDDVGEWTDAATTAGGETGAPNRISR